MTRQGVRVVVVGVLAWMAADVASAAPAPLPAAVVDATLAPARRLTPPHRSFSLIATGDVLTESPVMSAASTGSGLDFGPLFAQVTPLISSADIAICHMEMPIGAPGDRPGEYGRSPFGGNLILAPHEIASGVRNAGFDRCSTASNHSNDLGIGGIDSTVRALDEVGISHTGTATTAAAAGASVLTINGIRFAHLAYTTYSNTQLPPEPWRVNFAASPAQVAADVNAVRARGAEVVVVSLHLSKELLSAPTPEDRQFVVDVTALAHIDLVIEHGPHVIQPVEQVNGTWVYWSVGNFISGMGTPSRGRYADLRTLDGLAAGARFTETASGSFSVEPWPVLLCDDPFTRVLYSPLGVGTADLSPLTHAAMDQCIVRSSTIVTGLH